MMKEFIRNKTSGPKRIELDKILGLTNLRKLGWNFNCDMETLENVDPDRQNAYFLNLHNLDYITIIYYKEQYCVCSVSDFAEEQKKFGNLFFHPYGAKDEVL